MNNEWNNILIVLISVVFVAVVTFIVISSMGCHPTADGWALWFFVFYGGFLLLGL